LKGEAIELYSTVPVYPRFSFLTIQMEASQSNSGCIIIALITYAQVKHARLTCIRGRADAVDQCL
jgi:hypothetical protein